MVFSTLHRGASRVLIATTVITFCLAAAAAAAQDTDLAAVQAALSASGIPQTERLAIERRIEKQRHRFRDLLAAAAADAAADPMLLARVDKTKTLPETFVPSDLLPLDGTGISVSRRGHELRAPARSALLAMAKAARLDGVDLVIGSAYRSYAYQRQVFGREVQLYGLAQAERESARPGTSQHQLGMAMDFSPIDDSFASTRQSHWLAAHARSFGFSLSYPRGYERDTGYRPESWHYRFIGKAAAALEGEFFAGVQQYLIEFFEAYRAR